MPLSFLLQPGRARYTLVILVCSLLAVVIAGVTYTEMRVNRAEERIEQQERMRERALCPIFSIYLEAARTSPRPTSPYGERILAEMRTLHTEYECPR